VDDATTADLMVKFYQVLTEDKVSKAEALRRAQLLILQDPKYRKHPYFWTPFVLVGNWV
jgi:CHAT domain-containing protein